MTERQERFPALLEELRPQCEAKIAEYEHKRSALIPLIHLFQQHEGFASKEAMHAVAEMVGVTPADAESVVSFYTLFYRKPVGKYMLQVCRGLMCTINGADEIMAYFREKLGVGHLETTGDGLFSYEEVECLAACDKPACMQVNLEFVYSLTPQKVDEIVAAIRAGNYPTQPMAQTDKPERTWQIPQDKQVATGRKSAGARDQSHPNNAGGVGDASGIIMLDRFVTGDVLFKEKSKERTVLDPRSLVRAVEAEENGHAGH